jgi:predicted nucleic acid-binding protein
VNLYAESSAVLAWLLAESAAADVRGHLGRADLVVSSDLTAVECDRALRRLVQTGEIAEADAMARRGAFSRASTSWTWFRVGTEVLDRARGAFPIEPLRTLDALHLATALVALSALPRLAVLSLDERVRRNAAALGLCVVP